MRTIREEHAARLALDAALEQWSRTIDAWEAITWVIARDLGLGTAISERGNLRAFTLDGVRSIDLPSITILYEITEEQIIIHDARFTAAPHPDLGCG